MVKPPNILSERDCTNNIVVEACSYGALNLKPANTSTKVLDYDYKVFLGYSCKVSKGCWKTNSGKAAKPGIFTPKLGCDWDTLVLPVVQWYSSIQMGGFPKRQWKNFNKMVISSLRLSDEGAKTPKLVTS